MPGYSDPCFDTLALHAGATPDATGARAVPIHLTTSFVFESSDHAAALFNLPPLDEPPENPFPTAPPEAHVDAPEDARSDSAQDLL